MNNQWPIDRCIFELQFLSLLSQSSILEQNGGRAPFTYSQFQRIIKLLGVPAEPYSTVTSETIGTSISSVGDDHDYKFGVPTLGELGWFDWLMPITWETTFLRLHLFAGFDVTDMRPAVWNGGETTALAQLERHLNHKVRVAIFDKPKMESQSLLTNKTGLTPYLRFGCLSARLFYHQLTGTLITCSVSVFFFVVIEMSIHVDSTGYSDNANVNTHVECVMIKDKE